MILLPVRTILEALMTITWSPVSRLGAYWGLCLPRRRFATSDARRPRTTPSASTSHHSRVISLGFVEWVFIIRLRAARYARAVQGEKRGYHSILRRIQRRPSTTRERAPRDLPHPGPSPPRRPSSPRAPDGPRPPIRACPPENAPSAEGRRSPGP